MHLQDLIPVSDFRPKSWRNVFFYVVMLLVPTSLTSHVHAAEAMRGNCNTGEASDERTCVVYWSREVDKKSYHFKEYIAIERQNLILFGSKNKYYSFEPYKDHTYAKHLSMCISRHYIRGWTLSRRANFLRGVRVRIDKNPVRKVKFRQLVEQQPGYSEIYKGPWPIHYQPVWCVVFDKNLGQQKKCALELLLYSRTLIEI